MKDLHGEAARPSATDPDARLGGPLPARRRTYRSLFENAIEGIYRTTPDGCYLDANRALARIYGYDSPEQLMGELTDIARLLYVDPGQRERFKEALTATDVVKNFEAQVYRKDGSVIWISENARAVRDTDGEVACYEGTVQDVTERRRAEERLKLAAVVFDNVTEAILVSDAGGVVQAVNPAFERMMGWSMAEVAGQPSPLTLNAENGESMVEAVDHAIAEKGHWRGEAWATRRDGEAFPISLSVSLVGNPGATVEGEGAVRVAVCRDITRRKIDEERIRFQARHDALTRLINRQTVMERLDHALSAASARNRMVAVLFLDLNRFKDINDSFGHAAGDALLSQAASRLKFSIRASDLIGRIGGDEFVVVLPDVTDRRAGLAIVDKIRYAFSDPFPVAGRELFVSTSIGVATFPEDGKTAEELLSNADAAMYASKTGGRPYCFYDPEMTRQSMERLNLENDLRRALERHEFRLVYQPKIDAPTDRIVGAEALIRWHHPERGEISPNLFIPIAERAGLMQEIGNWTLREACSAYRRCRQAGLPFPPVSVNLSPAQFNDDHLPATIAQCLAEAELPAECLELEITETIVAAEPEKAALLLTRLKEMGVGLSIDDFGTGYSSFSYLKSFPVGSLKIDRSFVAALPGDLKDGAIISAVVALATNLGFGIIAEGVETEVQVADLLARGCRVMQGFFFSPPVDEQAFGDLLRAADGSLPT